MPLVRMKAAPVKTDGERLGNEFMNGVFFRLVNYNHMGLVTKPHCRNSSKGGPVVQILCKAIRNEKRTLRFYICRVSTWIKEHSLYNDKE